MNSVLLIVAALIQAPADTPVVFTNVNVVPMDGERVFPRHSVVIEGGIITRIGRSASIAAPRGALSVDGTGKYLLPGLVDVHVHLAANPEEEQRQILKLFLANGVTTVVNLRGDPSDTHIEGRSVCGTHSRSPDLYRRPVRKRAVRHYPRGSG